MNKKELRKAFEEKLIDEQTYKQKLFDLETAPREIKRKEQRLPKSISPEEFKKLILVIPKKDYISKVSFLLAYGSGLRISEIVGSGYKEGNVIPALTIDNFQRDITPPQIKVYGKYSKERIVPVPKGWKEYMNKILPIKKSARTLERRFNKYVKKAGLNQKYTFHSLRHGFAIRLVGSGSPLHYVQNLLGHSNLATTSVYTKARPQDALKSYEDLF